MSGHGNLAGTCRHGNPRDGDMAIQQHDKSTVGRYTSCCGYHHCRQDDLMAAQRSQDKQDRLPSDSVLISFFFVRSKEANTAIEAPREYPVKIN